MARRKAARRARGKTASAARRPAAGRKRPAGRARPVRRKTATRKAAAKKKPKQKPASRKAAARKAPRKATRKKPARTRKAPARKTTPRKTASRKKPAARKTPAARKSAPRRAARTAAPPAPGAAAAATRKVPRLERARWRVGEDGTLSGPPPRAVAVPAEPLDRFSTDAPARRPAEAPGALDADSVGDESPGGDTPTPDHDRVDEIGHAVGVEFADEEVLEVEDKIVERDRHRWERDPGSSDDFDDR